MLYTVNRLDKDSNYYMILKDDSTKTPLEVHGVLKIQGESYTSSWCSYSKISEEVTVSGELSSLVDYAMIDFWQID